MVTVLQVNVLLKEVIVPLMVTVLQVNVVLEEVIVHLMVTVLLVYVMLAEHQSPVLMIVHAMGISAYYPRPVTP